MTEIVHDVQKWMYAERDKAWEEAAGDIDGDRPFPDPEKLFFKAGYERGMMAGYRAGMEYARTAIACLRREDTLK